MMTITCLIGVVVLIEVAWSVDVCDFVVGLAID